MVGMLRNDETIISSISVTEIVFDVYEEMELYSHSQSENLELFFNYSLVGAFYHSFWEYTPV